MKRLSLDAVAPTVRKFLSTLPLEEGGVELELDGHVVCRVVPPLQLSEAEKRALIQQRRQLIRRAQKRNQGVPDRVIAREVREAVTMVRRTRR